MADYNKLVDKFFESEESLNVKSFNNLIKNLLNEVTVNQEKNNETIVNQENNLDIDNLNSFIKEYSQLLEQASDTPPQAESETENKITSYIMRILPSFEFSQIKLGLPDTAERAKILKYFGPTVQQATTVEEKIQAINNLTNVGDANINGIQAFRKLMILKILKGILENYYSSPSGFVFESFFAALMNGQQLEASKGGLVDVKVGNDSYQVKLYSKESDIKVAISQIKKKFGGDVKLPDSQTQKPIEQPSTNLEQPQSLQESPQEVVVSTPEQVSFLIGVREQKTKGIKFYLKKVDKAEVEKNIVATTDKNGEVKYFYLLKSSDYKNNLVGVIGIDEKQFVELSNKLESTIKNVLKNLSFLVSNINTFYTRNDTRAAERGINRANDISVGLAEQLKDKRNL